MFAWNARHRDFPKASVFVEIDNKKKMCFALLCFAYEKKKNDI